MISLSYLIISFSCVCLQARGSRILVFSPMPWRSHNFIYYNMIKALAAKGHEIDFLTAVPLKNPPSNVRNLYIQDRLEEMLRNDQKSESVTTAGEIGLELHFSTMVLKYVESVFENEPEVKKLMSTNDTYDMVMSEFSLWQQANAIWLHRFNAIGVDVQALPTAFGLELAGLPVNPSFMANFGNRFSDRMTLVERLQNTFNIAAITAINYLTILGNERIVSKHVDYPGCEDRPPLSTLSSKHMALVLVNSHPAAGFPYPKAPHVKEIGGMTVDDKYARLPAELQTFLDEAVDGAVYFSLGSNVDLDRLLKDDQRDWFLSIFKNLKQRVLLKWQGNNMPEIDHPRVKISKWFPQQGILAHPNTKLFISHGGLQSTLEAVNYAVPMVGLPIFADQPRNILSITIAGCGVSIDIGNFTQHSLTWAIEEVLNNKSYKEAMIRRSAMFRDKITDPTTEAVYWIEYVLKHGNVLQPTSARMSFIQLYLLDVLFVLILSFSVLFFVLRYSLKKLVGLVVARNGQRKYTKVD
ncbi:glucuronosyltransferase [Nesidiocoris tenuis]|uniref:UDP-glucuronosyltransferase n=1 Tax=Nesidiocoris tenuis TaxID=355587 RepID=A0ABN7ASD8_9HEMI|nr:glucuronosyltransferase [Nesidiocoris tenuis]